MTPDDAQIDVLMRRYASQAEPNAASEHLDADELNAFAEGSLPPAARSSYVSHLAACDDCRKLATQLTVAAGAGRPELAGAGAVGTESLWRKLTGFFATPALRYAAFASVLIVAGGVVFFSLRQPSYDAPLVAKNESAKPESGSAVKPDSFHDSQPSSNASPESRAGTSETPQKSLEPKTSGLKEESAPPSTSPETLADASKTAPPAVDKKAGAPFSAPASPSYAPPPPGEGSSSGVMSSRGRDERNTAAPSGPRKSDSDLDKLKSADRSEMAKDSRADDENRAARNQSSQSRVQQRESPRPSGPMLSRNQQSNEVNRNQQSTDVAGNATTGAGHVESEKQRPKTEADTRSAGGHKFRKQGSAWVDAKFKSSMPVISIARGSDDFRALDSGIRSIADQLGGEVIVVSKGKAYRIR